MGLLREQFTWSAIGTMPLTIVGILLGTAAGLRLSEQYVLASLAVAAAAFLCMAKILQIMVAAKNESLRGRITFALISCTSILLVALLIINGIKGPKTGPYSVNTTQQSGNASPNINGVGGDVRVTIGNEKEKGESK